MAVILEIAQLIALPIETGGTNEKIEPAIAIEIVHHRATGECRAGQDSREGAMFTKRGNTPSEENFSAGIEPLRRHFLRMLTQRHVGEIEEPTRGQIARIGFEQLKDSRIALRTPLVLMDPGAFDR